ncbi:MAG: FAD-dependent monooxygenase [Chloroflexi bacterium]|nr:FAD-dependent monooxygenase [Chloroflexota bacterium]
MTNWDYDIIIVGAGIAGTASALALAPEGYRILLLDQATFPRHKPCGEGIMPQGVAILESLGILPKILAQGGIQVRGVRFRSTEGIWAGGDFPSAGAKAAYGVVMQRHLLDHLLVQQVKTFPNVTVREGFKVMEALWDGSTIQGIVGHPVGESKQKETFRASLTLGADGMLSVFHKRYGIQRNYLTRKRFGITGHLSGVAGMGEFIEVMMQTDGEIYAAPCDGDVTLVALLFEKKEMRRFGGNLAQGYVDYVKSARGFGERASKSELVPPVLAVGPLGFTVEPITLPGLMLIGDSAGFLDPITGEGMTMALKSVEAAVPVIKKALATGNFGTEILARYTEERARIIKDVFKLTQLMLDLSRLPWVANRAIRRLSEDQALYQKMLGVVTGTNRYEDIKLQDKLNLARG